MNQLEYAFTGGLAQILWDTPRESSKTDSVREDEAGDTKLYELFASDANSYSIKSQVPPTPEFILDGENLKLPAGLLIELIITIMYIQFLCTYEDYSSYKLDINILTHIDVSGE